MLTSVICEVGPGVVRLIDAGTGEELRRAPRQVSDELLSAYDQPLVLLDEREVSVPRLWRDTFGALLADIPAGRIIIVCPSGWPPGQVAAVTRLIPLEPGMPPAIAYCRRQLRDPAGGFAEVGTENVLVGATTAASACLVPRVQSVDTVVAEVIGRLDGTGLIHLDAPAGVPGATDLVRLIAARLRGTGRSVVVFDDRALGAAVRVRLPKPTPTTSVLAVPTGRRFPVVAGAIVGVAITVALVATGLSHNTQKDATTTDIVEGRMTVEIPAGWTVQRLIGGPGSNRLQISDPAGSGAMLHLTQSRVRTDDLSATATDLRSALAGQDPAVFVAFNAVDERVGRPAVTYRELRPGHDIEWTVLVDNGVRISIGCQSTPDHVEAITVACDRAITSARGIRP